MSECKFEVVVEQLHLYEGSPVLKAFASIIIDDSLRIKGVRVLNGRNGLFVAMPQEQGKDKRWYDLVRCLNDETRLMIQEKVLMAYQKALDSSSGTHLS